MAAPTFVNYYEPASSHNTTTPKSVTVTTAVGDRLALVAYSGDSPSTINTPTGGTSLTWTLKDSEEGFVNFANAYVWSATATTAESFACQVTNDSGSYKWHFGVFRFSGSGGFGAAAGTHVDSAGGPTVNITTTQANSAIVVANVDWDRLSGASRAWLTNAGALTEESYAQTSAGGGYTGYSGYHADAGAIGTYAVGLSAPTGQKFSIVALEVLGSVAGAPPPPRRRYRHLLVR